MYRLGILLSLLIASTTTVEAFSFEPITHELSPSGQAASHVFRVVNTNQDRIAVRISVRPRHIDPDGTEVQGKESDQFIIYPRQMLLNPGEQRSVRVRWDGPTELSGEMAFRIIAEQLPVQMDNETPTQGGGITLTYRYEGSLYVVPPEATPDVRLERIERIETELGPVIEFEISNHGTRHALLDRLALDLRRSSTGETEMTLESDRLPGATGENMLAGSTRVFRVPAPDDLWDGPLFGELEFRLP